MDTTATVQAQDFISSVSADAIFATITALSVVLISGIAQLFYNWRKNSSYLRDLRGLLCEHLKILIQLIDRRLPGFEELSKVSPQTKSHFVYSRIAIPSEFTAQLPQVDLFRAIRKGSRKGKPDRIRAYSKLVEALNFISLEASTTESQFHYFVSNNREYSREYNDSGNEILSLYREFLVESRVAGKKPSDDPFLAQLNLVTTAWSQLPDKDDVRVIHDSFLIPVKAICVKYQDDPRRVPLLELITKADIAKKNRDALLTLFGEYFRGEVRDLRAKRKDIEDAFLLFEAK